MRQHIKKYSKFNRKLRKSQNVRKSKSKRKSRVRSRRKFGKNITRQKLLKRQNRRKRTKKKYLNKKHLGKKYIGGNSNISNFFKGFIPNDVLNLGRSLEGGVLNKVSQVRGEPINNSNYAYPTQGHRIDK